MSNNNGFEFDRGSTLSVFASDRKEDFLALLLSLVIAFGVYVSY